MNMDELLSRQPYDLPRKQKQEMLKTELLRMTSYHAANCPEYQSILAALGTTLNTQSVVEEIPFLPVRLFKHHQLKSVSDEQIQKILTSSGTTGQQVSRIYLDKETAILQSKTLTNIVKSYIGTKRLPMILVDSAGVIKNKQSFSARGAGLLGLMIFGRDHFYLLDEDMQIRWDALEQFLSEHAGEPILLFGFTFMVWQFLYQESVNRGVKLDLDNGILIHSGGWKKLLDMAVSNDIFKERLRAQLGIQRIYNFYGMVEQVGSIFMECEQGHLHAPNFAEVIVRDMATLQPISFGQKGIIQVLSILPRSYPGHSLLTEDLGVILGEDDCPCGRCGKYFRIDGRIPAAELRGCSDTYAYDQR